jgi:hypothetical protein
MLDCANSKYLETTNNLPKLDLILILGSILTSLKEPIRRLG